VVLDVHLVGVPPMTDFHQPQPVQKCAGCGADCDWCVGANKARAAFPRAIRPPHHDKDADKPGEHHCHRCFMKLLGVATVLCDGDGEKP